VEDRPAAHAFHSAILNRNGSGRLEPANRDFRRLRKLKIRRHIREVLGCPSWTLIEPCASRRSLILGASWQVCGRWS
jgi:hypothetical protein